MNRIVSMIAVIALTALAIGAVVGTTGCGADPSTPEDVTVELLQALDQFDTEVDPSPLDTLDLPLNLRLLIASSEASEGYGLIITGSNDSGVVASPFPTGSVYEQPQYKYVCVTTSPYPVWVYTALVDVTNPTEGTLSFTQDGERAQCYLAATESCRIVVSSLAPWGKTVGAPRQFFFNEDATATVGIDLDDDIVIRIGWPYRIIVLGYIDWTRIDGAVITTVFEGNEYIVGQIIVKDGVVFAVFGGDDTGLAGLLQLIGADKQVRLTCYFTWVNVTYEFTIWVEGTGPGGGGGGDQTTGTVIVYPEEVRSR